MDQIISATTGEGIVLNDAQTRALADLEASIVMRRAHLLTGFAGSGKTTLVQTIAERHAGRRLVLCGPTHKACEVLRRKLPDAINVCTIHSLLSLRPKTQGARQVFVRRPKAPPVTADIVIIDEASMLDLSLMRHIGQWLSHAAVIFVGDPAQLPPVGETHSLSFTTLPESHLAGIVRQAEGNPIIAAAGIIRASQSEEMDWSWTDPVRVGDTGIFAPGNDAKGWMKHGFTSEAFAADPDTFRYLTWTNDKVERVNAMVRRWLGHDPAVPFVAGERAMVRSPLVIGQEIVLATNEEVAVETIEPGEHWGIATWEIRVRTNDGDLVGVHVVHDWAAYKAQLDHLAQAAIGDDESWEDYHKFKAAFVDLRALYALTTHNAQGSTFRHVFLDLPEYRRWIARAPDEGKKGLYVAVTRASQTVTLAGA